MPIDPHTPVIVGIGQVVNRPVLDDASTSAEPLSLMADALRLAGEDASGMPGQRSALLDRIDEMSAVPSFVWHVNDPALAVSTILGIRPASTRVAYAGGTTPQTMLFDAARRIAAGELDVAAIVGAEAMRSRDLARRRGERAEWATQPQDVAPAPVYGEVPDAMSDHERTLGMAIPVHTYALFEHALRRARGLSRTEHERSLGRLASRMSEVAATNELAWIRDRRSAESITTPSPQNRMVSLPYTKLLTSNVVVDMGAALLVCSLEAARSAGVPDDRLVFPLEGAVAREQWLVSQRAELSQSLAMRACAQRLFGEGVTGADELASLDLYSCFPAVVQMAGDALGIDVRTDPRAPSVTGGMTFFGGPGNNYVTHSLATMAAALRSSPGTRGLVTGLGWYCSTHAWGTYSTTPPQEGFRLHDVQADVDVAPLRAVADDYEGRGEVESYTVVHDRDGIAQRAIVSILTPSGSRRLASTEHRDEIAGFIELDPLGASASVSGSSVRIS
ncbi:MAG TPA: hypothetical protein VIE15_01215 [Acidimicrobiales bacterium]